MQRTIAAITIGRLNTMLRITYVSLMARTSPSGDSNGELMSFYSRQLPIEKSEIHNGLQFLKTIDAPLSPPLCPLEHRLVPDPFSL